MPPTLAERLLIIALASVGLIADTVWMLNDGSDSKAYKGLHVPDAVIEQRIADFGAGPRIDTLGTEGDYARAGYSWAMEKRPKDEAKCPPYVPAFQRGCAKWLADIRDVDPGWSDDTVR